MTDEQNLQDNALALKIAVDSNTSCQNFTHKDMLNPSPDYGYANNPGIYACSSQLMKAALSNSSSVITCNFVANHTSCPFYSPDYSIVLKSTITNVFNTTIDYFLTRFRSFDGSYFYKIYNSNSEVFVELFYPEISNIDKVIDQEAKKVFYEFLTDSTSNEQYTVEDPSDSSADQHEQKNTKSYLNSLIS